MASSSSEPFSAGQPGRRVAPVRATASSMGDLPLDALFGILLHLPAKELCRLRLVCRSWRSLLSDPHFAAAYAARHPEPLIIVAYNQPPSKVDIIDERDSSTRRTKRIYESDIRVMDLSGQVLKQVRVDGHITSVSHNLACVKRTGDGSCRLVNAATGAVYRVPEEDPAYGSSKRLCLFGQVAEDIKVLRRVSYSLHGNRFVLHEMCTISRARRAAAESQWRVIEDPPRRVRWCKKASVVIDGVVFFLTKDDDGDGIEQGCWIVSFDLVTERWRPTIRGPQCLVNEENNRPDRNEDLLLVNLNGSLVVVRIPPSSVDLWYLLDFQKSLWVKQYSIQIDEDYDCSSLGFCPLTVLDDGSIVMEVEASETLEIYDPRSNEMDTVARTGLSCAVSVYTGTLLSLEG